MLNDRVGVNCLRHIAEAVPAVLQDAEVFLDQRERVLEMFGKTLVKNQVESVIGERRLECVAPDKLQAFVEVILCTKTIYDLQAVLCKVQHVDLGTHAGEFSAVTSGAGAHFQNLHACGIEILLDGFQHRGGRRVNLVHVVFAFPKTIPYGLVGFFNCHNRQNIRNCILWSINELRQKQPFRATFIQFCNKKMTKFEIYDKILYL